MSRVLKVSLNKTSPLQYSFPVDIASSWRKTSSLVIRKVHDGTFFQMNQSSKSSASSRYPEDILFGKIQQRLQRPLFGFTSCLDLAPPPSPTLHWKTPPIAGEYHKVRNLVCNGALHVWLLSVKLKQIGHTNIAESIWSALWQLTECWVVDASVPRLGSSGEVNHMKEIVGAMTNALSDCLSPMPYESALLKEDAIFDGVSVIDRVGALHYLLWLTIHDETIPLNDPFLIETMVFILQQRTSFELMSADSFLKVQWNWLQRK